MLSGGESGPHQGWTAGSCILAALCRRVGTFAAAIGFTAVDWQTVEGKQFLHQTSSQPISSSPFSTRHDIRALELRSRPTTTVILRQFFRSRVSDSHTIRPLPSSSYITTKKHHQQWPPARGLGPPTATMAVPGLLHPAATVLPHPAPPATTPANPRSETLPSTGTEVARRPAGTVVVAVA